MRTFDIKGLLYYQGIIFQYKHCGLKTSEVKNSFTMPSLLNTIDQLNRS